MAGKKREDVREEDVTGLKYFDKLAPLLARLHHVGCQRDKARNRKLHFDQYGRRWDRPNATAVAALDTLDRNGQWRQVWPNARYATT